MTGGAPRNQTGESPLPGIKPGNPRNQTGESLGIKPGNLRNQTGRSPESNRAIPGIKPVILFQDFHQKTTPAKLSQIWLNLAVPPKHAQFHQETGRCHN